MNHKYVYTNNIDTKRKERVTYFEKKNEDLNSVTVHNSNRCKDNTV